jgi:hypothetical protein
MSGARRHAVGDADVVVDGAAVILVDERNPTFVANEARTNRQKSSNRVGGTCDSQNPKNTRS